MLKIIYKIEQIEPHRKSNIEYFFEADVLKNLFQVDKTR